MKPNPKPNIIRKLLITVGLVLLPASSSLADLTNGLVGYWPLDQITGCNNRTPELVNGYDLQPMFGGSHVVTNFGPSTVVLTNDAVRGNAMYWPRITTSANRSLLGFISVNTNDLVPVNRLSPTNWTVSFWVKSNPTNAINDIRLWSEGNINNNNPGINMSSWTDGNWDFFTRQGGQTAPYFNHPTGESHNRGSLANVFTDPPAWHNITIVQEYDGVGTNTAARRVYVDGVLDPATLVTKPDGLWNLNTFSIGGWLRQGVNTSVTAFDTYIDDVAEWSRVLTESEIAEYIANGITNTFAPTSPLQVTSFGSNMELVDQGDSVTLSWAVSPDVTGLSIDNGVGNVLPLSACGVGSISVVPTGAATVYTLTATRGAQVVTSSVTVKTAAPITGWNIIDHFASDDIGLLGSQANWTTLVGGLGGNHNPDHVLSTVTGNKIIGLDGDHVLTASYLGPYSSTVGKSNTLFFRFYLDPSIGVPDENQIYPQVDIYVGIGNRDLRDEFDYRNGDNGAELNIVGNSGGPINLIAMNGVGGALGQFNYLTDVDPNGLVTGKVYTVWIDLYNTNNDTTLPAAAYYSLHLQREDEPARTNLFSNFVAPRDASTSETWDRVHIVSPIRTTPQGTNVILFDDFYISENGYVSGAPLPAGSFAVGSVAAPTSITIGSVTRSGNSVTLNWSPLPAGFAYTFSVERRSSLTGGNWNPVAAGVTATTFTDTTASGDQNFYRILSP